MKIVTLVENTSNTNLKPVHGLSLYIETKQHKILFDLGPDDTFFANAKKKNIDLSAVDTVIISHGHFDHGGGLKKFLEINKTAKIYIQRSAFEPYYTKVLFVKKYIGLDTSLMKSDRFVLLDGDCRIDDELSLFTVKTRDTIQSEANASLYSKNGRDDFHHEQNLIINENKKVLISGCSHKGILNILGNVSGEQPDVCIGGFHVYNPVTKQTVSQGQLEAISEGLKAYKDTMIYTCHCTGKKAFAYFNSMSENIKYLACGDELEF